MDFLYHYTSLETLALILKNQTIRFNNLVNVDDVGEAETNDMGTFGRFIYISCWTEDDKESIPLWNLYTKDMHGVRLKLPKFPFQKYHFEEGQFLFNECVSTYIDYENIYNENLVSVTADQPKLIKVGYTDKNELLFPRIKRESVENAVQKYTNARDMNEISGMEISYDLSKIAKYKQHYWEFQEEWRYIISVTPMGLQESSPPTFEKQQEFIRRIEDANLRPKYDCLYLKLDKKMLNHLEVVFGPKMTEAEKVLASSVIREYAPGVNYSNSELRIR